MLVLTGVGEDGSISALREMKDGAEGGSPIFAARKSRQSPARPTLSWMLLVCVAGLWLSGCSGDKGNGDGDAVLRLATNTSTVGSGLLAKLLPIFEAEHEIDVTVFAPGSGAALQAAREGKADVVLVHAKEAEDVFLAEGYGVNRQGVMYNDFVILGPPEDPAGIEGTHDALAALRRIEQKRAPFLSRGDNSGTHIRESALWRRAGVTPQGEWFSESGQGIFETLRLASDQGAYIFADRSAYLFNQHDLNLWICVEGDERLFNPYSVIPVNPAKVSGVSFRAAMDFVDFLTSPRVQAIIARYGKDRFGETFYTPMRPTE